MIKIRKCSRILPFLLSLMLLSTFIHVKAEESAESGSVERTKTQNQEKDGGRSIDDESEVKDTVLERTDFIHGFVASISVIIVSELGDKTFFIAAIMAMRHSRTTVFLGAMFALGIMTVLAALFGWVTTVIPRVYTFYISTALFAFFGLKMLKDGINMSGDEGMEELEEVQSDLKKKEDELEESGEVAGDVEAGTGGTTPKVRSGIHAIVSRVFLQAFTMTFLAEWGDRSQLATIILAAREDVTGVTIGAVIGHALCTGLAVLGGRMVAQKISVKTVTIIGGIVFLIFAVASLIIGPDS
ncbi:putative divalent cation/proton antiporter TMEM165 [Artemia franciscana]|uniref:GDT1 family protein n=1 Tax=Artemia franciscana TaxID=6661 RepID=A0AA88I2X3_ARTSF|nr:hypothetical protein QYM36_009788 [Artemia franciscana]